MFTLIPLLSFELSFVYTWTDSILHSFPFKSSFISILLLFSLPILWFSLIFFLNSLNPLSVLSMCMVLESSTREWRAYKEKNHETRDFILPSHHHLPKVLSAKGGISWAPILFTLGFLAGFIFRSNIFMIVGFNTPVCPIYGSFIYKGKDN